MGLSTKAQRNVRISGLIGLLFSSCVAVGSMTIRDTYKVDVDRNKELIKRCEVITYGVGLVGLVSLGLYGLGRYSGKDESR